jgi:steroid delta-isomerase-like uncharacterized protein
MAAVTIEWAREFCERWLAAWASHEADRVLELMTEDIVYDDDGWPRTMHSHADVREFITSIWEGLPDLEFELLDGPYLAPGEPRAAYHWRGHGTHTGPLARPGVAPTGRRVEFDGAHFHEYRDGRVARLRCTFDNANVARQLGLLRRAGGGVSQATPVQRLTVRAQQMIRRSVPR